MAKPLLKCMPVHWYRLSRLAQYQNAVISTVFCCGGNVGGGDWGWGQGVARTPSTLYITKTFGLGEPRHLIAKPCVADGR